MATPLPKQTAANDKLIANTPYDQLTQRQKDYADRYGVPLKPPSSGSTSSGSTSSGSTSVSAPVVTLTPVDYSHGTHPNLDSNGNLLPTPEVRSQIDSGFDSTGAARAAGINLTLTPNGNGSYPIDGKVYYSDEQQQVAGGPGMPGSQGTLLAILADPYMNATAKQNAIDQYNAGQFGHYDIGGTDTVNTPGARPGGGTGGAGGAANGQSAVDVAKDAANRDALASIKNVLGQYGLDSLSDFAWQEIVNGRSGNEVLQDIRETPQFKQRFPAIEARQKAGLPPLSPGDYVSYENTATQYMRDAGLPKGFYDSPEDFTKFLSNDVSLKELGERVNLAKDAAYNAPTEVRSALRGQFGLGDGDLAAFFLDPNKAQPLLQRTYNAATIAGAGTRTGYNINADQDYRLADLGVTAQQAQSGFNTLQQSQELFNPLTGHSNEGAITTDQQLGAAFGGNAADNQLVERRRSQRQAEFADGGGFAATQQGVGGLGSASK